MNKFIFSLLISFLFVGAASAEFVAIENLEGREIEVELLGLEDGEVEFKMRSGKKYTVAMSSLAPRSRKLIKKWHEEASKVVLKREDRIKTSVLTKRNSKDTDGGYSGWKDMSEKIEPGVLITNEEYQKAYTDLKATIVLLAEDVTDRNNLKVVLKESFTFSVDARDSYRWEGKPFKLDYLIDDNDSYDNSYGFRYRYSFLVIRNPDGSAGHIAASVSAWGHNPNIIDTLEVGKQYTRDLR